MRFALAVLALSLLAACQTLIEPMPPVTPEARALLDEQFEGRCPTSRFDSDNTINTGGHYYGREPLVAGTQGWAVAEYVVLPDGRPDVPFGTYEGIVVRVASHEGVFDQAVRRIIRASRAPPGESACRARRIFYFYIAE